MIILILIHYYAIHVRALAPGNYEYHQQIAYAEAVKLWVAKQYRQSHRRYISADWIEKKLKILSSEKVQFAIEKDYIVIQFTNGKTQSIPIVYCLPQTNNPQSLFFASMPLPLAWQNINLGLAMFEILIIIGIIWIIGFAVIAYFNYQSHAVKSPSPNIVHPEHLETLTYGKLLLMLTQENITYDIKISSAFEVLKDNRNNPQISDELLLLIKKTIRTNDHFYAVKYVYESLKHWKDINDYHVNHFINLYCLDVESTPQTRVSLALMAKMMNNLKLNVFSKDLFALDPYQIPAKRAFFQENPLYGIEDSLNQMFSEVFPLIQYMRPLSLDALEKTIQICELIIVTRDVFEKPYFMEFVIQHATKIVVHDKDYQREERRLENLKRRLQQLREK